MPARLLQGLFVVAGLPAAAGRMINGKKILGRQNISARKVKFVPLLVNFA
jgi:hypothetical protein